MRELLTGVVASGEVVGGVFLAGDELFGVEELAVGAGPDLVDDGWLQIHEHRSRNVLPGTGLAEERVEGIVRHSERRVTVVVSIQSNQMK